MKIILIHSPFFIFNMKDNNVIIRKINNRDEYAVYDLQRPLIRIIEKEEIDIAKEITLREAKDTSDSHSESCRSEYISVIYIILTNGCNLACDYCFARGIMGGKIMNDDTVNGIVNRLKEYFNESEKKPVITFYGGEPLLNHKCLFGIMDKLQEIEGFQFQLVTNGTLFSKALIDSLKNYPIKVGISLDGSQSIHDKHRKYHSGKGSFDEVFRALERLILMGLDVSLSITLTKEIIQNEDEVFSFIINSGVNRIAFNLLRCVFYDADRAEKYYSEAANFLYRFYQKLKPYGIIENSIFQRMKALYNRSIFYSECAVISGRQITIDVDGSIYTCQVDREKSTLVGNVFSDSFSNINLPVLEGMIPILNEDCQNCFALPICGGGCPIQSRMLKNNYCDKAIRIHYSICSFSKILMDNILEDMCKLKKEI